MTETSTTDAGHLSVEAYRSAVAALLTGIQDAAGLTQAVARIEQRLALVCDPRFLGELTRAASAAPGGRARSAQTVVATVEALTTLPVEQIGAAGLATLWLLWGADLDAFRMRYQPFLDSLFDAAVGSLAAALQPYATRDPQLAAIIAKRRPLAGEWARGWAVCLLDGAGDNPAALPGAAAMQALVRRARQRLGDGFLRLATVDHFREQDEPADLMLAFWAWALREAVGLAAELPQASDAVLADILLLRALARLQTWRDEAAAAGRTTAVEMVLGLCAQLVAVPEPAAAPGPLPALLRLGRVETNAALYDLVCTEPWLLDPVFAIPQNAASGVYLLLDSTANPARVAQNLALLARLRATGADPAVNPVARAARRVYRREVSVSAALAGLRGEAGFTLLDLITAAMVAAEECDHDDRWGACLAEICFLLAEKRPDQPVLWVRAVTAHAYARFGHGETRTLLPLLQRACAVAQQANHAAAFVVAADLLGQVCAEAGDTTGASAAYTQAINAGQTLPYRLGRNAALLGMAHLAAARAAYDELGMYLDLIAHYGLPDREPISAGRYWALRAEHCWALGNTRAAEDAWERGATIAIEHAHADLTLLLCREALRVDRADAALTLLALARDAAVRVGDTARADGLAAMYAELLQAQARNATLDPPHARHADLAAGADLPSDADAQLALLFAQARRALGQGDTDTARWVRDQIRALHSDRSPAAWSMRAAGELALIQARLGAALQQEGLPAEAEACYVEAEAGWREIVVDPSASRALRHQTLRNLQTFYLNRGDVVGHYGATLVLRTLEDGS